MSGLSAFRFAAAPTPTTTTYNGSYATTQADAQAKCQGNNAPSVTRSATSTVSLVDAIQKAKNLAIDAIACPVFTGSYTTTNQDYINKCGVQENVPPPITRSATSGKDQATADAAAKQLALDAITCPVPLPVYNTTLDAGNTTSDGMLFAPAAGQKLQFDALSNTSGNSIDMQITDTSDGSVSYVTFNDEHKNRGYAFFKANGSRYDGAFPTSDQNISV